MSAAAQSLLVFAVVGVAAGYLLARAWRKHRRASARPCGSDGDAGCGCTRLKKNLLRSTSIPAPGKGA